MAKWIPICKVDDIPVLGARVIERPGLDNVAVFRNTENEVFALLDKCPHKAGPLSQGIVCGRKVVCPLHNWNIEFESGCAVAPDEGQTKTYTVKIENDQVLLDQTELAE